MSLLRIYASLSESPQHCQWVLVNKGSEPVAGEGRLAQLPRRAERIQLVVPATQVLITRARVPKEARRRAGMTLAFAVEDQTTGEPDTNQVSWLGRAGEDDVLAVVDKAGATRWRDALASVGVRNYEIHCEMLLLPWASGKWSVAWNGHEGFVRSGEFEGVATDSGDGETPPLSLRLILEEAQARGAGPDSIAVYASAPDAAPDVGAWTRELGIAVSLAGYWDWRAAPIEAGVSLGLERQRWGGFTGTVARLRPAAWILGAALALEGVALAIDWASLAHQQRSLRQSMESRFRATFRDAVAVVDPALQMRRKLAEARHATGQADSTDFLPMLAKVTAALKDLPAGVLRIVSYESGRMTLELATSDDAFVKQIVTQLVHSGLSVEPAAASKRPGAAAAVITVRSS
jgi:general secretion pathway protein L